MPYVNGQPYATNDFVWRDWQNGTGYSSNGFAFVLGMLNGAFAVGTPDITSHLAEVCSRTYSRVLSLTHGLPGNLEVSHQGLARLCC